MPSKHVDPSDVPVPKLKYTIQVIVEVPADEIETVQEVIDSARQYGSAEVKDVEVVR